VKIAVVTHFFPPEPGAGALRVHTLARALSDAGHDVSVITGYPSFPQGRFTDRKRAAVCIDRTDGFRTVRLASLLLTGMPGARLMHWVTAAFAASFYLVASRERYDVVIMSSPPITLALPALVGAARHRARLVVDVRDVFPDIAIAMGVWKPTGIVARTLEHLVRFLYHRADLVSVVTPTALTQIAQRGVEASRLVLARNAAERAPQVRALPPRADGFTAVYAGNLGLTTDIDVLADAATLVAPDGIAIEIVGDGAQRARLDERVRKERIPNLRLRGSLPRPDAMAIVANADVAVIPLRKGIEESIPTKLYDALSVGCPVIVAAGGEAKTEGTALGAICTPAGDAQALADALRQLSRLDKTALRALGDQGKERVRGRADRTDIMADLAGRIAALC
jgi:glycosyltransferase involved in cell wall biosynthesis